MGLIVGLVLAPHRLPRFRPSLGVTWPMFKPCLNAIWYVLGLEVAYVPHGMI